MKKEDIKVGMKVIPHSKSAQGRTPGLKSSRVWKLAQQYKQPYLYVNKIPAEGDYQEYLLSNQYTLVRDGDYFLATDFEPLYRRTRR